MSVSIYPHGSHMLHVISSGAQVTSSWYTFVTSNILGNLQSYMCQNYQYTSPPHVSWGTIMSIRLEESFPQSSNWWLTGFRAYGHWGHRGQHSSQIFTEYHLPLDQPYLLHINITWLTASIKLSWINSNFICGNMVMLSCQQITLSLLLKFLHPEAVANSMLFTTHNIYVYSVFAWANTI